MTRVRPGPLVAAAASAAAFAALWLIVRSLAVDVPHWDEWEFAPFLARAARGDLSVSDFLVQYNEHRMAVARGVIWTFATLLQWDLRLQSLVAPGFALLTFMLLARVGAVTVGYRHPSAWVALALTAVFLSSPTQDDTWMMALQHVFLVPGLCLAAILVVAGTRWPWWIRWISSAACAAAGTFSIVSGLLLWLLPLPALWWPVSRGRDDGRAPGTLIWTIAAALTGFVFFRGYAAVGAHPDPATPFSSPWRFWMYALTFLGGPFSRGTALPAIQVAPWMGAFIGLACLVTLWWCLGRASARREVLPWLVLAAFAVAHALAGAMFRSGFGGEQALASRYATFALLLPVSTVWLAALAMSSRARAGRQAAPWHVAVSSALAALLLTMLALSSFQAVSDMVRLSRSLRSARAALGFLGHVTDTRPFTPLFPRMDLLRDHADSLWDAGWLRPPHRRDARVPASGDVGEGGRAGWIERGQPDGARLVLEGWAVIPSRAAPADIVALASHDGGPAGTVVAFGTMQPDEPKDYLGVPADYRRRSGWRAVIDEDAIPAGTQWLSAWALDADSGRAFRLNGEYRVER